MSANSKSLAVDATYTYTAKKTYITNEDSSGDSYVVGDAVPQDTEHFDYTSPERIFTIEDTNGDKYISLEPNAIDTAFMISVKVGSSSYQAGIPNPDDIYVIETAMKPFSADGEDHGAARQALKADNGEYVAKFSAGELISQKMQDSAANGIAITADSNGWYHARLVLWEDGTMTGANQNLSSDFYDINAERKIGTGNKYSIWANKTVLMSIWPTDETKLNDKVGVSYIKQWKDKMMSVMSISDFTNADREVVLYLTDDIDESTLNTIKVYNAEDVEITSKNVTVDAENRSIKVSFPNGLLAGTYILHLQAM